MNQSSSNSSPSQDPGQNPFRFACSVNPVIFTFEKGKLCCLIIERLREPDSGALALPGRFIMPQEDPETVVRSLIKDNTGLSDVYLKQVRAFGEIGRHPVGRVISIGFYALVRAEDVVLRETVNHRDPHWCPVDQVPELALDHNGIIRSALRRMGHRIRRKPVAVEMLPARFTLGELQALYEAVLGAPLDKRNFRRKVLKSGAVIPSEQKRVRESRRPATLYSIDKERYSELRKHGENFAP